MRRKFLFFLLLLTIWPVYAFPHAIGKNLGEFYVGFLHPVLVLTHLLSFIAMGIINGQQGKSIARKSLIFFVVAVLSGCISAYFFDQFMYVTLINKLSLIILGALAAISLKIPKWLTFTIIAFFGMTHGYENGLELSQSPEKLLFISGLLLGSLLIFVFISALTITFKKEWTLIALRVVGSWIAAIGMLIIGH